MGVERLGQDLDDATRGPVAEATQIHAPEWAKEDWQRARRCATAASEDQMLFALALLAAPSPDVAMMDVAAGHGVPPSIAKVLNEGFLVALRDSRRFGRVIGGSDLRTMIEMDQQKAALGCEDDSCLAELGGALGVPYLVSASVAKLGGTYVVQSKLISVEDALVVSRAQLTVTDEAGLIDTPRQSVAKLVGRVLFSSAARSRSNSGGEQRSKPAVTTPPKPIAQSQKLKPSPAPSSKRAAAETKRLPPKEKSAPSLAPERVSQRKPNTFAVAGVIGGTVVAGVGAYWWYDASRPATLLDPEATDLDYRQARTSAAIGATLTGVGVVSAAVARAWW